MLIFCCQDLDDAAALVRAAALGPFLVLTDISVGCNQIYRVITKGGKGAAAYNK